jgi:hypothetical protein
MSPKIVSSLLFVALVVALGHGSPVPAPEPNLFKSIGKAAPRIIATGLAYAAFDAALDAAVPGPATAPAAHSPQAPQHGVDNSRALVPAQPAHAAMHQNAMALDADVHHSDHGMPDYRQMMEQMRRSRSNPRSEENEPMPSLPNREQHAPVNAGDSGPPLATLLIIAVTGAIIFLACCGVYYYGFVRRCNTRGETQVVYATSRRATVIEPTRA